MKTKRNSTSALLFVIFGLIAGGSFITGEPMELVVWIIIFIIIAIIAISYEISNKNERATKLNSAIDSTINFTASTTIQGYDARYSFSIDQERRKVLIAFADYNEHKTIIDFADIISVELLEDSNTTFSKSTMRTIGGGVVGGVLAGGVGAIVGGLSGDSKGKKKTSRISVKIRIRNQSTPSITIDCYKGEPIDMTSDSQSIKEARSIVDHVSVIIDMIDRENAATSQTKSIADELEKLCSLKEKGILTEEEFQMQKSKLLS